MTSGYRPIVISGIASLLFLRNNTVRSSYHQAYSTTHYNSASPNNYRFGIRMNSIIYFVFFREKSRTFLRNFLWISNPLFDNSIMKLPYIASSTECLLTGTLQKMQEISSDNSHFFSGLHPVARS